MKPSKERKMLTELPSWVMRNLFRNTGIQNQASLPRYSSTYYATRGHNWQHPAIHPTVRYVDTTPTDPSFPAPALSKFNMPDPTTGLIRLPAELAFLPYGDTFKYADLMRFVMEHENCLLFRAQIPSGNLFRADYERWIGRVMPNMATAFCRVCGFFTSNSIARLMHQKSGVCRYNLSSLHEALDKDHLCVVCERHTEHRKWGFFICSHRCEFLFMFNTDSHKKAFDAAKTFIENHTVWLSEERNNNASRK